jgi:hypothetical protein
MTIGAFWDARRRCNSAVSIHRASLRRLQWDKAQTGDTSMLIWLGKILCGQRDTSVVAVTGPTACGNRTNRDISPVQRIALMLRYSIII